MKTLRLADSEERITEAGLEDGSRLAAAHSVLLLVRGSELHKRIPIGITTRPVAFNQDVKALVPKAEVEPNFLLYWLLANRDLLLSKVEHTGIGAGKLDTQVMLRLPIRLPPKLEQTAIGSFFESIDDRIALFQRMNETLEAIAFAIFKSWFVDFDPVRAKATGQRCSEQVSAVFPGSFQESSMGQIPKEWRIGRLDDLLLLQRGFDLPSTKRTPGPYPVLTASGQAGTHSEFRAKGPGVTTGRSGLLGKIFFVHEDFWPLNTSLWVKEFRASRPIHAFYTLKNLGFASFNAGSAVPTLNRNHVHGLPVVVPPLRAVQKFEEIVLPVFRMIRNNECEAETVTSIRDALLPKLMSGELRIKDADKLVEADA
jgi:type I restriction enzyme S subunit